MKKFTALLIGCSLALAGAAVAQQPDESPDAKKQGGDKKHAAGAGAEAKPNAGSQGATGAGTTADKKPAGAGAKAQGTTDAAAGAKGAKADTTTKAGAATSPQAGGSAQSAVSASPAASAGMKGKGAKGQAGANAKASPTASPAASASAAASKAPSPAASVSASPAATTAPSASPSAAASVSASPATTTGTSAATAPQPAAQPGAQAQAGMGAKKKPEPEKVQQIKQQHANFRAQPRPDRVPTVTFQANYQIHGAQQWQGPQYEVYRSYRPERHDEAFYRSRYQRVELIGGGYYYYNAGYWYPAWGYSPQAEYYAYDAPIYVGQHAEPPDKVIANVQAALQEMGLYRGEVDGLLGPLTREALTAYQSQNGLMSTAVIDQPTLDALGMS